MHHIRSFLRPALSANAVMLMGAVLLVAAGCSDDDGDSSTKPAVYDIQSFDAGPDPEDLLPETFVCNPCNASSQCGAAGDKDAKCVDLGAKGGFCGRGCSSSADCPKGDYECKDVTSTEGDKVKQCVAKADCTCSEYAAKLGLSTWCTKDGCKGGLTCYAAGKAPKCDAKAKEKEVCDAVDNDCDGTNNEDTCDDGNLCTDDSCNPFKGCVHIGNGKSCDDGSKCTKNDACTDGKCGGEAIKCDDGKVCTTDACDKNTGCTHKQNTGKCDDGDACTVGETCSGGKCSGGKAKACDDGNACTDDACKSPKGTCAHTANKAGCDDGDKCTAKDACADKACKAGAKADCDDKNACTTDSCDAKKGCVNLPVASTPCDDGNPCTDKDMCDKGTCKAGAKKDCDDKNVCTDDTCDAKTGCVYKINAKPCDDGNACTEKDVCKDKQPKGKECVGLPLKATTTACPKLP